MHSGRAGIHRSVISSPSTRLLHDFPWPSRFKRLVDAALQRIVHDEVEARERGQLISHHRAGEERSELALQPLGGELVAQRAVVRGVEREHRDVRSVALVAGPRVCESRVG